MTMLNGKVALVTGGSRGIGAAIAHALAIAGADVAITHAASSARADAVVAAIRSAGRRAVAFAADVGDATSAAAAVDQTVAVLGRLDIVVNNAGNFVAGPIDRLTVADFDRSMDVNVKGVFVTITRALPHLAPGSRIITIGSSLASRTGRPGVSLYAASKAALVGLTRGIARDIGDRRITVNLIQPGPTDTEMNPADSPRAAAAVAGMALPGYGEPADVAAMVVFLAGEGGRQLTGAVIDIDGGSNA